MTQGCKKIGLTDGQIRRVVTRLKTGDTTAQVTMVKDVRVLCAIAQQVTWEGKTHKELIDTPSLTLTRIDRLERRIDVLEDTVDEYSKRLSKPTSVDG